MGTMIDLTDRSKPRRYPVDVCYYCQEDGKHTPKPILPTDKNAQRQPDGSMKCGTCVISENKKMLSLFGGELNKK